MTDNWKISSWWAFGKFPLKYFYMHYFYIQDRIGSFVKCQIHVSTLQKVIFVPNLFFRSSTFGRYFSFFGGHINKILKSSVKYNGGTFIPLLGGSWPIWERKVKEKVNKWCHDRHSEGWIRKRKWESEKKN